MNSLQKQKRYENEEFKQFVREQPCLVFRCDRRNNKREVHPHHTKTVGSGGSDLTCVPVCDEHHTEAHWSQVKFQEKYKVDFRDVQIEMLEKFVEKGDNK